MAENFEKPRIPIQAWANDPYFKSIAPVYNPDDSYAKGQLAISPLGTLVKALEDTTGTYDPSKWQETKLSESLEEAMDRGIDILLGWKAGTQPDVSKIPQGVEVTYQETVYTGTKVASALTKGQIVFVGISDSEVPNIYKEYITYKDGENYSWEMIGTTEVNLDGYARQIAVVAESNRTVNGYQVPVLSNTQLITIYNGVVAGDSVVITDATGMMHFEGINADMISDEIFVSFRYFDKMLLEYDEQGNIEFTPIGGGEGAVKYDVEQTLTDAQKEQARQNIGAQETIPEHTYDAYGAAETVQENLDTHAADQSLVDNFSYDGVDLGVKFAGEIAAAPYNGDPAAWIKGRIRTKNYKGLHLRDYFTITCANGTIIKPQIMGINTYKGSAATEIGDHIDFISKDCWPGAVQYNPVNYNNGIGLDKFTGDGATTVFQLCHRSATTFPALSKVTIGGADAATDSYTYDATTGVLTFSEAPASGAVIKAVWATPIVLPFLASKVHAFLMSEKAGVPNEAAADPALVEVDYTNGGVWKNIPDNWKAVIVDKLSYPGVRYTIGTLRTSENTLESRNLGKLWLPDECEVYGCQKFGHTYTAAYGRMYPGFLDGNRKKGDGNGAVRTLWWLLPASPGNSTAFCCVYNVGRTSDVYASLTVCVPVCFRITG